jgi:hypothetical protein
MWEKFVISLRCNHVHLFSNWKGGYLGELRSVLCQIKSLSLQTRMNFDHREELKN